MLLNTSVRLPKTVAQLAEDVDGLTQVTTAMRILVENPVLWTEPADALLERLGLHGERFRAYKALAAQITRLHSQGPAPSRTLLI